VDAKRRSAVIFVTTVSGKENASGSTELLPGSLLGTSNTLIKFPPPPLTSLQQTTLKPVYFYKQQTYKLRSRDNIGGDGAVFKLVNIFRVNKKICFMEAKAPTCTVK